MNFIIKKVNLKNNNKNIYHILLNSKNLSKLRLQKYNLKRKKIENTIKNKYLFSYEEF